MTTHRFSVVIPTRERADTLAHALRTCVEQDYDDCEIVVSDNHSSDHTREVVAGFRDPRVKYVNPGRRLSMVDNFEHAFEHVGADTVAICLGDDDGLMPGALAEADEIMASEKTQALAGTRIHYDWPGLLHGRSNQLVLPLARSGVERRSTADFVRGVLAHRVGYGDGPMLYQGFVSSRVLQAIKQRSGRLFRTLSPDVYAVFAVSAVLSDYTVSRRSLVVDGASPRSNGAVVFGRSPDSTEAIEFRKENTWSMHPGVRYSLSMLISAIDAFLHARDALPGLDFEVPWSVVLPAAYGEVLASGDAASIQAVELMAADHGVRLPPRAVALFRHRSQRVAEGARRWRRNLYLDCSRFGVQDVHGAARLALSARDGTAIDAGSPLAQARLIVGRLLALRARR